MPRLRRALGTALCFGAILTPPSGALLASSAPGETPNLPATESTVAPEPAAIADPASPASPRPKIGLALSGGGGRGIAHVGVLKALEAMRIPIDYIAGTSMGSIVGGLYASGMSPRQIEEAIQSVAWGELFTDRPPRPELSYRRKEDDTSELINLEIGLKSGRLTLPRGLVAGQKIDFLLQALTLKTCGIDDFDRLPIPFRAVATDLGTADMVVLSRGNLGEAMRASMSIPGLLAPVELEGRLLVDGGLARNLPVDVARGMGADRVIAIDVSTPLADVATLKAVTQITGQISTILTRENVPPQLRAADVVITPDLTKVAYNDYSHPAAVVPLGVAAVEARRQELERYAVSPEEYEAYLKRRQAPAPPPAMIDHVTIEGVTRVDRRLITTRMRTKPGGSLDLGQLQADLGRIYELGDFESVDFRVKHHDGAADVAIRGREKSWGPNYLRVGLNLVNNFEGDSDYRALGRYTRTLLNPLAAEWRTDLELGRQRRIETEFYQPLDFSGTWFIAPRLKYEDRFITLYDGDRRGAEYETREVLGVLDLGAQLGRFGEARVGLMRGRTTARTSIGFAGLPQLDIDTAGFTGRIVVDRLDDANFPHHGRVAIVDLFMARRALGSELGYNSLFASFAQILSRGRHHVFFGATGGSDLGSHAPFYQSFGLGGLFSLSGYREGQLRGAYFGVARVGWYRQSGRLTGRLGRGVYLGGWVEAGNVWETSADVSTGDLIKTATIALGADSFLGPFFLAYGRADDGHASVYLSLGRSLGGSRSGRSRNF